MNKLLKLKNNLQDIVDSKPTNQELMTLLENLSVELDEIIEDEKNFFKIDKRKSDGNSICEADVKQIAAEICKIDVEEIGRKTRQEKVVCARWLVLMYFARFTKYTRAEQGALVGKDHSTACNAIKEVQKFTGWRRLNKIKFENKINLIHEALEINRFFE